MYQYVEERVIRPYRKSCSDDMVKLRDALREKYDIVTQFSLVGSGSDARNMVTQNGDGPFDLDYNLQILSMPQEYWNDLRNLKETIRRTLNEVEGKDFFADSKDSTSVLTSILHFENSPNIKFSFDIGIIAKNNNGNWCRLIHNKNAFGYGRDQYTWNEIPGSHNVKEKAIVLKKHGAWNEVRDTYLKKKNMYLLRRDTNHPSYIVYVETVNEIYRLYFS